MNILEDFTLEVTILAGENRSTVFDVRKYSRMMFLIPSGWTSADLGFMHSEYQAGVFNPTFDYQGNLVEISVPSGAVAWFVPNQWTQPTHFVRLWSQRDGNNVAQTSEQTIKVCLKT